MEFNEIQELIKLVNRSNKISEITIKKNDFKLTLKTQAYVKALQEAKQQSAMLTMPMSTPSAAIMPPAQNTAPVAQNNTSSTTAPSPTPSASKEENTPAASNIELIKSPMIGTFYRSPSPDKPVFVKVGDTVAKGDVICIIEAMKLFNEIEAEVSGRITKVLVEDASPVEFDQAMFEIEPS